MTGWRLITHEAQDLTILVHESGAKASFAVHDFLQDRGPFRYPKDPFAAFAAMIQDGLRPFKVEGFHDGLALPGWELRITGVTDANRSPEPPPAQAPPREA